MPAIKDLEAYFWAHLRAEPGGCVEWTGSRFKAGYGRVVYKGKMYRAHRLAWQYAHGEPPPGDRDVLHTCDNPPCCNAMHLYTGTDKENKRDAMVRGRAALGNLRPMRGDQNGARRHPERMRRGENHPNARLTQEKVDRIFSLANEGLGVREIAPLMGISKSQVSNVLNGENTLWRPQSETLTIDRIAHARTKRSRGAGHYMNTLDQDLVDRIFALRDAGASQQSIADALNRSQTLISRVLRGATEWSRSTAITSE